MTRKSQRNFAKRVVVGYFGLRDRRKFKKYQRKLGSVAAGFEVQDLITWISCKWLADKRIIRVNQIMSTSLKSCWKLLKVENNVQLKVKVASLWRKRPDF